MAFLAEQRIAAVARADRLDRQLLGEMHDEAPRRIKVAGRMQALDELSLTLDARQRLGTHARHQAHVRDHIGRVGDLDATAGDRRIDRSHAIGNHIHRAALHAAGEQGIDLGVGRRWMFPVVVRSRVVGVPGTDKGQVLNTRHIRWMRAVQITPGMCFGIQGMQVSACEHQLRQRVILAIAAVAPMNSLRFGQRSNFSDPLIQGRKV